MAYHIGVIEMLPFRRDNQPVFKLSRNYPGLFNQLSLRQDKPETLGPANQVHERDTRVKLKKNKTVMWGLACLTACLFTLSASTAFAGTNKKLSKDLPLNNPGQVDVIVQYDQVPTSAYHQKVISRGGVLKRDLGHFKGGAYTMPASALANLASDPNVLYISPDRPLSSSSNGNPTAILDDHLASIGVSSAWNMGLNGANIGVAVIDSGIAAVPDLAGRVVYSQDFVSADSSSEQTTANDLYGHGTHVAGIIAGSGAESDASNDFYTFKGLAPGVSLVNLRVLDQKGAGTDSQVIAAIQSAIALKSTYNIRVINLSLGRPVYESYTQDPLCQAVEQAWKAGIFVAVAAGNYGRDDLAGTNGYGTITAPGNDPYVMTVGAINTMGSPNQNAVLPTSYSSKGPTLIDNIVKPDISAPGNLIISLYTPSETLNRLYPSNEIPYSLYQNNGGATASPYYYTLSGTSMATPMVSGAAALAIQGDPSITPDQIKAMLMQSAFKNIQQYSTATDSTTGITYYEQADIFTVGAGYLDIPAAAQTTQLAPANVGSSLSPIATWNSNGNVTLTANGSSVLGGTSILWGSTSVWGNSILWGSSSVEGSSILWGSSTSLDASSILWGSSGTSVDATSILWGSTSSGLDAESVLWGSKK
jgi:serine protease AprX